MRRCSYYRLAECVEGDCPGAECPSFCVPRQAMPSGPLVVRGVADSSTGYGQMTSHLIRGLEAEGLPARFLPIHWDEARWPVDPDLRSRMVDDCDGPALTMANPFTSSAIGSVLLTMWEATHLPAEAVGNMNRHRAVVVPCEANARWFIDSGVKVPIRVVPLGIDPTVHHPRGRPAGGTSLRVGAAGRVGEWGGNRKGLDVVARAFLEAFPDRSRSKAVLEVKTWADCRIELPKHPRIRHVTAAMTDAGLADWYRSLDVFVSASKGEGWGLQPHQAMACGTPAIAPHWGGHAAYMTPGSTWPVAFDEMPAGPPYYTGKARWCVARRPSLVAALVEAGRDPGLRRAKGEAAACRAVEFTWHRSARELAAVLREFGFGRPAGDLAPATGFDAGRYREIKRRVEACPHRGGPVLECGCTKTRICLAGKGRPIPGSNLTDVTERDCLACAGGD